jgi:hypothetical protein
MEDNVIDKTECETNGESIKKTLKDNWWKAVILTIGLIVVFFVTLALILGVTKFFAAPPTVETYEIQSFDTNGIYVKSENGGTQLKTYDNEDITFFPTDKGYDYMEVKKYNIGITVVEIYTSEQTDSISFAPKVENPDNSNSFLRNFLIAFVVINGCLLIAKSRS